MFDILANLRKKLYLSDLKTYFLPRRKPTLTRQ